MYTKQTPYLVIVLIRRYNNMAKTILPILGRSIIVKSVMRYEVIHCSNETMYRDNRVWFG